MGSSNSPATVSALPPRPKRPMFIMAAALVVLLAAGLFGYQDLKYQLFPKRFGEVVPNQIYRSGQIAPRLIKPTLQSHHIQVVIDFQGEKPGDAVQAAEQAACRDLAIQHARFPLAGDGTGDIHHYADALMLVVASQRAAKPVLLHCSAGTQRTGAATAFYRLLIEHKPIEDAYAELAKYDWNPRKDQVLIDYMNAHMLELSQLLVERGVIDHVPDPLPQFHH